MKITRTLTLSERSYDVFFRTTGEEVEKLSLCIESIATCIPSPEGTIQVTVSTKNPKKKNWFKVKKEKYYIRFRKKPFPIHSRLIDFLNENKIKYPFWVNIVQVS
jgi:hypothetical protein